MTIRVNTRHAPFPTAMILLSVAGLLPAQGPVTQLVSTAHPLRDGQWSAAVSGRFCYVTWVDGTALRFRRSTDGGESWSTATTLVTPALQHVLAVQNQHLVITYQAPTGPHANDVRMLESPDGGGTWSAPITINAGNQHVRRDHLALSITYADTCVVWREAGALKFQRVSSAGPLANDVSIASATAPHGRIALRTLRESFFGPTSALVSYSKGNGSPVACAAVCTDVATTAPTFTELQLETGGKSTAVDAALVANVAGGRTEYHVAYVRKDHGAQSVRLASCAVGAGAPHDPTDLSDWRKTTVAAGDAAQPSLHVCDSNLFSPPAVVVAYLQDAQVRARVGTLEANGVHFLGAVHLGAAGSATLSAPRLDGAGRTVLCVWEQPGHGGPHRHGLRVNRSVDAGANWLTATEAPALDIAVGPNIAAGARERFVARGDDQDPSGDTAYVIAAASAPQHGIVMQQLMGSRSYGAPAGSLDLRVTSSGRPSLGGQLLYRASVGKPAATGVYYGEFLFGLSGSDRGPTDLGLQAPGCAGSALWIGGQALHLAMVTSAAQGATSAMNIPNSVTLLGQQIRCTALVQNGASSGCPYDTANGVETYLF